MNQLSILAFRLFFSTSTVNLAASPQRFTERSRLRNEWSYAPKLQRSSLSKHAQRCRVIGIIVVHVDIFPCYLFSLI
uniref:Secreted protein n=1 Tax=Parascaris univalens TaxID=6257 RepID=A0A915CGM5_PARUN